jgi:glycosyltransferase involved in cell wall biosynthesis
MTSDNPTATEGKSVDAAFSSPDTAIIVPTHNSAQILRSCLASIQAQTTPCILVVVDNGSTDDTVAIAREFADIVLQVGPERSAQRNAGAAATNAPTIGFIDSDMVLPPNVAREASEAIRAGATAVVVPERTLGEGFWADVRAYERTFYQGSDAIEAPRFFSRVGFDAAGGFDEAMTGGEDWDLGIRIAEHGHQVRIQPVILHHEGRVRYLAACRKKAYYAPGVTLFLTKHGSKGMALFSHRPWLRQPRALARPLGIGLLALKAGELSAVLVAMASARMGRHPLLPGATPSEKHPRGAER